MDTRLLLSLITVLTPCIVFAVYYSFPESGPVKYFMPRFLHDREYPRKLLRQAGSGFLFSSLWLVAVIASVSSTVDFRFIDKMYWLLAMLFFVFPAISAVFFFVGVYYLAVGFLAVSEKAKPRLHSIFMRKKRF